MAGSTEPASLHMRQPPAERVRFILILKLLGLLHSWLGEWLRTLALRLAGEGVGWALHALQPSRRNPNRTGESAVTE